MIYLPHVNGFTSGVGDTPWGLRPLELSPPRSVDPSTLALGGKSFTSLAGLKYYHMPGEILTPK